MPGYGSKRKGAIKMKVAKLYPKRRPKKNIHLGAKLR